MNTTNETKLKKLLIMLQEEAVEITQCADTCVRFGIDAIHHDKSNRVRFEEKAGNFLAILKLISEETKLDADHLFACADIKLKSSKKPAKKSRRS